MRKSCRRNRTGREAPAHGKMQVFPAYKSRTRRTSPHFISFSQCFRASRRCRKLAINRPPAVYAAYGKPFSPRRMYTIFGYSAMCSASFHAKQSRRDAGKASYCFIDNLSIIHSIDIPLFKDPNSSNSFTAISKLSFLS